MSSRFKFVSCLSLFPSNAFIHFHERQYKVRSLPLLFGIRSDGDAGLSNKVINRVLNTQRARDSTEQTTHSGVSIQLRAY